MKSMSGGQIPITYPVVKYEAQEKILTYICDKGHSLDMHILVSTMPGIKFSNNLSLGGHYAEL